MPFPVLAHQAPVLPLKAWRPGWFDGVALVVGSMAPDCETLFEPEPRLDSFAHTIPGQFWFCLPFTLGATWLLGACLARPLARRLPTGGPLYLADLARLARRRSPGAWWVTVTSALIGSFSHIALDGATHSNGWLAHLAPALAVKHAVFGTQLSFVRSLQYAFSLLGALVSTAMVLGLLHARRLTTWNALETWPAARTSVTGTFALVLGAVAGGWLGYRHAAPTLLHPAWYFEQARFYVWGHVGFSTFCGVMGGLFAGGAFASVFDARSRASS